MPTFQQEVVADLYHYIMYIAAQAEVSHLDLIQKIYGFVEIMDPQLFQLNLI